MTVRQEVQMREASLNGNEDSAVPDKEVIRAEWAEMRDGFHQLLAEIPEEAWRRPSKSTRWTIAELCAHIAKDVEDVPMFVDHARQGKDLFNFPSFISQPINWLIIKFAGRGTTPTSLARKFDEDCERALDLLDEIEDDEWGRGANFFGVGRWTVEHIFHQSPRHFEEHAAQVRESLS